MLMLFSGSALASNPNEVTVVLDGEVLNFDVPAQIIDERTMVPMRAIFEKLGATVEWDGETNTVTAHKKGVLIDMTIGDTAITRNTIEQGIDVPAQLVDGRTLVPVRVVSEYMGANVSWNQETKTVTINSTNAIQRLDWNNDYEYYGQTSNGKANGYGILYSLSDGSISQLGIYTDSKIVLGTDFFNNGDFYTGKYKNGNRSNGTYYYAESGNSYVGDFKDGQRHGNGTFHWADGSFHDGKWEYNKPNGYGIMYDSVEDVQYKGNYIDGKRDGSFVIEDFFLGTTYYATYDNGVYIDQNYYINKYNEEHAVLINWAEEEVDKIYAEGQKIYNQIMNKYNYSGSYGSGSNGGNIDSYAAANAMRQQAALMEQARVTAEAAKKSYIAEALETLAKYVEQKDKELKIKYNIK